MVRCRCPLILSSAVAVVAFASLAVGCGGGGAAGVASVSSSAAPTAGSPAATTTVQYGSTGASAGALAFARCMRSHGIPNWPDPGSNGAFDKTKLRQLRISPSRVRAIEERSCNYDFENGGRRQRPTITAADRTDYLEAAACMRRHEFPDFPDPTFQNNDVNLDIPSSINTDSPQFKSAARTCTKLIPAGLPYSRPDGS
jgi:hypothetical protein